MTALFFPERRTGIFLFLWLFISSCNVTLLSAYDDITDKTITEMQQETSRFFVRLEMEPGSTATRYENVKPFYEDLKVKAATIRIRNGAIEKNNIMIGMINELEGNIGRLEQLHKSKTDGILQPAEVALLKSAFESQYGAIIKFQMVLKRRAKS